MIAPFHLLAHLLGKLILGALLLCALSVEAACPSQYKCTAPQTSQWFYNCTASSASPQCQPAPVTTYATSAFSTQAAAEDALKAQWFAGGACSVSLNIPAYSQPMLRLGVEYSNSTGAFSYTAVVHASLSPACATTLNRLTEFKKFRYVLCPTGWIEDGFNQLCRIHETSPAPEKNCGDCTGGPGIGVGNPIHPLLGNKYQIETDYRGVGPLPLVFTRTYNSLAQATVGPLQTIAPRWRSSFERAVRLVQTPAITTAFVYRGDGKIQTFDWDGTQYVADADVPERLATITNTSGIQTGWQYTTAADEIETYDLEGRLTSIGDRAGNMQTMGYSAEGLLTTVTHSSGRQLSFTYAPGTYRLATMTMPGGGVYQYQYDQNYRLASVTYPDSSARTYVYGETAHTSGANLPHALTGILDENNSRFATYKYDTQGRAISTEHALGAEKVSLAFTNSSTTTMTDALGTVRTLTFQTIHGVVKTAGVSTPCTQCGVSAQSLTYDVNGNVSSRTDFNGNKVCYENDLGRNLETVRVEGLASGVSCPANLAAYTPAVGTRQRKITTQWHASYRRPTQIDEPSLRTTFTHDAKGNVLTKTILDTTTSESRSWTYTYNLLGQVLTSDGPRTDVPDTATYTYYNCTAGYQCGQIHTLTDAAGHVTTYGAYNAHGQPLTITDPNGVVTTLTYDLRQRLTSRTVGSEQTTFDYWPTGLLKKLTQPDGSFLEYTYDAAHRLTGINDSEGNRIEYTLDAMGNRTAENLYDPTNALTQTRTRVFNTLNQLWKEIGGAGTTNVTTTYGYDNNSNQTSIAAPLGRNTGQVFDELNRLTQITDPLSGVTQYGYNALDQLISVTDPRSKVTSYAYNAFGDVTEQVSPDTGTTINTYDSAGNLLTSADARGKTATYGYDALSRVTSVTYPDQTISYTYDSGTNQKGRLTQVTDGSGSTSWTYDPQGRVLSRQQSMGVTKSVGYAYDFSGRLQTLTLPSGNTIGYSYTDGKVTGLTLNGSTTILSNVLYQPFGPTRGWTWGNGSFAIREYDTDGLITALDSAELKSYDYDDAFRITSIVDAANAARSQSYGYDLLDRLTSATGTSLNQGWTYDANGNRLTQTGDQPSTYTISGTSNRLSGVSGALTRSYAHNASGSITSDGSATFSYDDAGRLVSATKAGVTTGYALNALGQRVRKTSAGTSTYFVYDEAGHLVGEYDNTGALIQETVWFGDIPVATIRPDGASVELFYVHTDHLDTPRRISRPSDNVIVWRWDSDPFGTSAANQDPDGDTQVFVYGLRFPGQYADNETGLYYNYFRDYDPSTGRYIQSDPIGLQGGLNTYVYVRGNPVEFLDPFGLQDKELEPPTEHLDSKVQSACDNAAEANKREQEATDERLKGNWDGYCKKMALAHKAWVRHFRDLGQPYPSELPPCAGPP